MSGSYFTPSFSASLISFSARSKSPRLIAARASRTKSSAARRALLLPIIWADAPAVTAQITAVGAARHRLAGSVKLTQTLVVKSNTLAFKAILLLRMRRGASLDQAWCLTCERILPAAYRRFLRSRSARIQNSDLPLGRRDPTRPDPDNPGRDSCW